MKNPVHPGRIVRHDCLDHFRLSVTAGAKVLGVSRQALNNVVNGRAGISPEMAIRLTKVRQYARNLARDADGVRPGASAEAGSQDPRPPYQSPEGRAAA